MVGGETPARANNRQPETHPNHFPRFQAASSIIHPHRNPSPAPPCSISTNPTA
ncbi:hypothetical protein [Kingella bonacorsii]|uniref:Uncharacterized protein n=1 Tax=Kingella bonacorsii TaxID=2796361 RepID=A0ABS1BVC7_9NEIS|nr:hypothetical protein [Kingella bonacorsii]MBK0397108.1 hypothetical protein [Kingella bonacorsii]